MYHNVVSIHTPTKGVTYFHQYKRNNALVSIHTPTKGVTPVLDFAHIGIDSFNPHTHEGCDCIFCK